MRAPHARGSPSFSSSSLDSLKMLLKISAAGAFVQHLPADRRRKGEASGAVHAGPLMGEVRSLLARAVPDTRIHVNKRL